ncbi:MAG: hypothetical protein Q9M91_02755 [Candidatus Dojkabacteria bacterium]|nr:hypothetical protein [Candidatus Dojkabacteria bacterium]MDQ7020744.1 hypothetical protein [Candidatus Dojkabacteria bacterium]
MIVDNDSFCGPLDTNSDSIISLVDLTSMLSIYKQACNTLEDDSTFGICGRKDTNNDGKISLVDIVYLLSKYKIANCGETV